MSLKEYTAQEVRYRDGGETLKKLEKQAATATGAELEKIKEQMKLYKKECWIILHGIVYDCTGFLKDHPGGPDSIVKCGGKDATMEFEDIFHSSSARESLKDLVVGKLDTWTGGLDDVHNANNGNGSISEKLGFLIPVLVVVAAVAYFYMSK